MTDDPALLADLRRRLSSGRGPDNRLDGEIHLALLDGAGPREPWTASTDSALYLLVRVGADLPGVLGRVAADVADRVGVEVVVTLPRALIARGIEDIAA